MNKHLVTVFVMALACLSLWFIGDTLSVYKLENAAGMSKTLGVFGFIGFLISGFRWLDSIEENRT